MGPLSSLALRASTGGVLACQGELPHTCHWLCQGLIDGNYAAQLLAAWRTWSVAFALADAVPPNVKVVVAVLLWLSVS